MGSFFSYSKKDQISMEFGLLIGVSNQSLEPTSLQLSQCYAKPNKQIECFFPHIRYD
jgi:hypothetical protein